VTGRKSSPVRPRQKAASTTLKFDDLAIWLIDEKSRFNCLAMVR
jgi:hypothetical protein